MATDRTKRELAVILHADVAGYSKLMERDEDLTHQLVNVCFDRLEDYVRRFGGSVCEKRGDALLARVEQPSDGLGAAVMYQYDANAQDSRFGDDVRPELRNGINLVVIDKYVLEYLKATDEDLRAKAGTLRFNLKPLEDKTLHLCVRNKPGLKQLVNDFNAGLEQIDAENNVRSYFENAFN